MPIPDDGQMGDVLSEFESRLRDKEWRLRNLYLILDERGDTIPLRLRPEQEAFMQERHTRNFVPKARKLGLSTFIVLDYLDDCLFYPQRRCGHIDLSEGDAHDKLEIARFAWEQGPDHPQSEIALLWEWFHQQNPRKTDARGEMAWANGSRQTAGCSYTGKTPQRLHISEYGPISALFPAKAASIKRGSMNAVPARGVLDVETTMEGGRFGECYDIFKLALDRVGQELSPLDWKLHFFSWLNHPAYDLPGREPTLAETREYFQKLAERDGEPVKVSPSRQAWYEAKRREQGEDMYQQFPTVVEECDRHVVVGQIYPEITRLRAEGRVCDFHPQPGLPLFTCWDLGAGANSSAWLVQPAGKETNWLDWASGEGKGASGMASTIGQWTSTHGAIQKHLVPHDANITDKGSGKTLLHQLVECGIPRRDIVVVPRIANVWTGIGELRKYLPNSWFHSRTDIAQHSITGTRLPSGVGRLEGYRQTPDTSTGITRSVPFPDLCSHTADAARTYAEARAANLLGTSASPIAAQVTVKTGYRGRGVIRRAS